MGLKSQSKVAYFVRTVGERWQTLLSSNVQNRMVLSSNVACCKECCKIMWLQFRDDMGGLWNAKI